MELSNSEVDLLLTRIIAEHFPKFTLYWIIRIHSRLNMDNVYSLV